jgi:dihydroceramidase
VYLAVYYPRLRHGQLDLMSASLAMVGIASFLFHATLRLVAQLSDDISMLLLAGTILQALYCAKQPPARATLITILISTAICGMSVFYIRSGNLLVHVGMFVSMLMLI